MQLTIEDAGACSKILRRYRNADTPRAIFELAVTAVLFVISWAFMWLALDIGYWLCLLLALPTAGFLTRLFMIQHDCGHGAFFRGRAANDWTGRIIGVMTFTPYRFWRSTHARHHSAVGNLERRGVGDIDTLTVLEYLALNRIRRFRYRIYRHPIFLFVFVPPYLFLLHYRLPFGLMRSGASPWLSTMGTNLTIAAIVLLMTKIVGIEPFFLVEGPVVSAAASIGVWFFYVQHQFEHTRWQHDANWTFHEAALHGSSYYELPLVLTWFTGNIGMHHVHHLCSRIPFYRLPEVLRDHPELTGIGQLTFLQSLRCGRLALWDESQQRLISFHEFHSLARAKPNSDTALFLSGSASAAQQGFHQAES